MLCIGDKKALLAGVSADEIAAVVLYRLVVSIERSQQPREIRDILAQRQPAIDGQIRQWLIPVVLRDQALAGSPEMRQIILAPPVMQSVAGIEHRPFVIEAMGQLMSNGRTDGAIIQCR